MDGRTVVNRAGDAGFTLVEVVISMTVIAVGVLSAASVTSSSMNVATMTSQRSHAVALATQELENLRAVPYEELEVAATTVLRHVRVSGTRFSLERATTWASQSGVTQAYKRVTIVVAWTGRRATHSIEQASNYYPGGLGSLPGAVDAACEGAPAPPVGLHAAAAPGADGESSIDLSWQPAGSSTGVTAAWVVERSSNDFTSVQLLSDDVPASSTAFRAGGLSAGTTYKFRVASVDACGHQSGWSPVAGASTESPSVSGCALGAPNVTPAQVRLANNGTNAGLATAPGVTVGSTGDCTGFTVRYSASDSANRVTALEPTEGGLTAVIDRTGPWQLGVRSLDVHDASGAKRATLLLTVCAHNAEACA